MFFPSADINEVIAARFDWGDPIPARMAAMLVVIPLVMIQLVVQISRGPEECLIQ